MPDLQYDLSGKHIWVAGHRGMVGAAIVRRLESENPKEILTATRQELDLCNQQAVNAWVATHKPDAIFMAAAKVGGIVANDTYPADFLYENNIMASNVIHAAHVYETEKLLFLGSSCIYPKLAPQPLTEDSLLTGPLEPTNQWYAVAKIAGLMMCRAYRNQYGCDFISAMPTNLYGPGDNYHLENSHVIPALIRKAHDAKLSGAGSMQIWGSGRVQREFMHTDDCADGLVFAMKYVSQDQHINISSGKDLYIDELAQRVMDVVGFNGDLEKDLSKPDGTTRKIMDDSQMKALGWTPKIALRDGLADAYEWFLRHQDSARGLNE